MYEEEIKILRCRIGHNSPEVRERRESRVSGQEI